MSEQEHISYLCCGIPTHEQWTVFLELMMDKNTTMAATPDEIIATLVENAAAIKRQKGLAPEALLLQRRVAKVEVIAGKLVKAAEVQRGIREIISEIVRMIGKRRISGSAFIASGDGTSQRTASESNVVILQRLPTVPQKHRLILLRRSPLQPRTIGWMLAPVLHPVIGSSIADA
jgi:hypothetical protein